VLLPGHPRFDLERKPNEHDWLPGRTGIGFRSIEGRCGTGRKSDRLGFPVNAAAKVGKRSTGKVLVGVPSPGEQSHLAPAGEVKSIARWRQRIDRADKQPPAILGCAGYAQPSMTPNIP
jgi:hypothetical protein